MITNFFLMIIIQLILVYIIDLSGVMHSIKRLIWRLLWGKQTLHLADNLEIKPFTCSKCMTWWTTILFTLIMVNGLTIPIFIYYLGFSALLSYMTTTSLNLLIMIKDLFDMIIIKLNEKINK